jgi:outer membrane protein TolC
MRSGAAILLAALAAPATAEPLTLQQALAAAEAPHPELDAELARVDAARAQADLVSGSLDPNLNLEAILRGGHNTERDAFRPDHGVRLALRKPLFDSGRTESTKAAADSIVRSGKFSLIDAQSRRRIEIMRRFFQVLAADQRYAAANEFMAVAYVRWDDSKSRHELGQISPVELAELESAFQTLREARNLALAEQRAARQRLASAMNRPDKLPAELIDPDLSANDRALPEFEPLLPILHAHNPRTLAQTERLAAAQSLIEGIRAEYRPSLAAELSAAAYSRESNTRDNLSAGLVLNWPLYAGRREDAALAREQAEFKRLQAEADQLALDLRQALLETWQEIEQLQRSARPAAEKLEVWRNWALEKARGEYEMELRTNLGNSMAETQIALLSRRAVEYRLAVAWARLEALLGVPWETVMSQVNKEGNP